jgi:hypothetical protein
MATPPPQLAPLLGRAAELAEPDCQPLAESLGLPWFLRQRGDQAQNLPLHKCTSQCQALIIEAAPRHVSK